ARFRWCTSLLGWPQSSSTTSTMRVRRPLRDGDVLHALHAVRSFCSFRPYLTSSQDPAHDPEGHGPGLAPEQAICYRQLPTAVLGPLQCVLHTFAYITRTHAQSASSR
ncbi:hypothetical protein DFH08DRAFT_875963, partial [Mycena albidolilacea]